MLRTHRAGKGPGGCGGWPLGSRNRRGPGMPPTPGLRGQGTSPGSPLAFLDSSGWGKCSSHLGGPLPPASPDLPSLPAMPPRTYVACRGLWRAGDQPESSADSPRPSGWAIALSASLPLLISLASLLCPQDPRGLDGPLWQGYWLGSSAASPARVGQAIALHSSPALPGEPLPPASPDLPGLRGADPVWFPLLLPP